MAYMEGLEGLRSNFEQNVYANGLIVESSTGSMALAKPKLRWQVNAPFPQIIIVSPGRVEIYDPDLSQLTIQETGSNQNRNPREFTPESWTPAVIEISGESSG